MRRSYGKLIMALTILFVCAPLFAQVDFDKYFIDRTMRVDYYHTGDRDTDIIAIDQVYQEGIWAGPLKNLIDPFNNGKYRLSIFDKTSQTLIYTRGFSSYFGEYQTTGMAWKGIKRTYQESARFPFPKDSVVMVIEVRDESNDLNEIFRTSLDPASVSVIKESNEGNGKTFEIQINGDPHEKVDLVFLAEGYTADEEEKAVADFKKYTDLMFQYEPYKSFRDRFNTYGVFVPSQQSTCDEPTHHQYRNTAFDATFNSLGSPRYLLTENMRAAHDAAGTVPYDAMVIMVNQKRYGGGGIYNFFLTFTTDNAFSDYLFIHEFGHAFAGLADEYYSSSTAYEEFFSKGVEPLEPNITALLEPENIKWKNFVDPGTPVPTPWNKQNYDDLSAESQKIRFEWNDKIAEMKTNNADSAAIALATETATKTRQMYAMKLDSVLVSNKYWGRVGAFEGAGYVSEGLYRPMLDCIMITTSAKEFCVVCQHAIEQMIRYYSE